MSQHHVKWLYSKYAQRLFFGRIYYISILIKIDQGKVSGVLNTLKSNWSDINKLDGDDFRYDFMDNLYGKLFKKQEQLKYVFTCLSIITVLIALFGLYAYAKYITSSKLKEIAIRKTLGANNFQIKYQTHKSH